MEEEDHQQLNRSWYFILFSILLAAVFILSRLLHDFPLLNSLISEASLVLLIGIAAGSIAHGVVVTILHNHNYAAQGAAYDVAKSLLSFDPHIIFMALMPPILFNSGYQLRRELFIRHIQPIIMFACLGTIISALSTAGILVLVNYLGWMGNYDDFKPTVVELLTFGSLISATDTVSVLAVFQAKKVDPHLFYLVFGESALNDAVSLVLFQTFSNLLSENYRGVHQSIASQLTAVTIKFFGAGIVSPLLGIILAFATALLFKHVDFRHFLMLELPLFMLLMYMPFVLAECFHLSGIITIFFSGIASRRYVTPNVSEETQRHVEVIFKLTAYIAETCIFLELGLSVFGFKGNFKWLFIVWAFAASLLGRAAEIYPLAVIHNWYLGCQVSDERSIELTNNCFPASPQQQGSLASSSTIGFSESDLSSQSERSGGGLRPVDRRKLIKDKKISSKKMHVMWFAGMRGAVAYACSKQFPNVYGHTYEFIATTMFIVMISIMVMGGATEHFLRWMKIEMGVDVEQYLHERRRRLFLSGSVNRFEQKYFYDVMVRHDRNGYLSDMSTSDVMETFYSHAERHAATHDEPGLSSWSPPPTPVLRATVV